MEDYPVHVGALLADYHHLARLYLPGLIVAAHDLPAGRSWYIKEDHTILIDSKLPLRQQELQAVHMLAHLHLGHVSSDGNTDHAARQEREATQLSTEWILPPSKLARLLNGVSTNASQIASYLGLSVWFLAAALSSVPREYWEQVRGLTALRLDWPQLAPRTVPQCVLLDALPGGTSAPADPLTPSKGSLPSPRPSQLAKSSASGPASLEIRRTGTRRSDNRPEQGPPAAAVVA
ncbi:ImmA/IrrE family metallo-endopeptidase [Nocardia sp. NPDC051570]|uniref:ImmA/IrrE family metallo-endopeptidase n=1 Tax=Nocardia sp. NPDC051570 TaxID=3364324 RepID=UPI0037B6D417